MIVNRQVTLEMDEAVAVVTLDAPPVNAFSAEARAGVLAALRQAHADPASRAIVLICAGRTFIAGADFNEFDKPPQPPSWPQVVEAVDASRIPIVMALHGGGIGGGLELAMVGHYRLAARGTTFRLPEVSLGLIPASGGTQRLPRLVGVRTALDMVVLGRVLTTAEALAAGLIDQIVEGDLRSAAVAFARDRAQGRGPPRRAPDRIEADPAVFESFRREHGPALATAAARAGVWAVEASVGKSLVDGLAAEQALYRVLKASPEARALLYVNRARRLAAKAPADGVDAFAAAMARHFRDEAEALARGGVAADAIDQAVRDFGFPSGMLVTADRSVVRVDLEAEAILRRCLSCALQGVAEELARTGLRASDIDAAWVTHHGWPAHRGGPLWWAREIGLAAI